MTPFLPLRLSSHQDLNSVPTLAPGLPASSTPTLNHTITPCCSRLPSPCLPILVSVLDISSVASEPLCPHKAQFLTFLEGFLPLGPLYKSKREALTSPGGKVICKICSRIWPNLHKGFYGGLVCPPEPLETEDPKILISPCISEPSPFPSAPCTLLLVVGVDHLF